MVYTKMWEKNIKNEIYLARGKNILPLVPTLAKINFTNSNEEGPILISFKALGSLFKVIMYTFAIGECTFASVLFYHVRIAYQSL